jgi:hypothetical protein
LHFASFCGIRNQISSISFSRDFLIAEKLMTKALAKEIKIICPVD